MTGHRHFLVAAAAGLGLSLAAAVPADAQQPQGELMRDTLSTLGLIEKEKPAITYRERAPLVMPPKLDGRALPPPRSANASPEWPREPEVLARQKAAEEARLPRGGQPQGRYNDNNATLSVDDIRSGRRADANMTTEVERKPGDGDRAGFWVNPWDLMKGVGQDKTEPSVFDPSRDTLTDPPNGYRRAPKPVVKASGDPINNPSREREESDPGVYLRGR